MKKIRRIALLLLTFIIPSILCSCIDLQELIGTQVPKAESKKESVIGKDGTSLLTGNGIPSNTLGTVGDSYIDLTSWDFYLKETGGWTLVGNIKGSVEDSIDGSELNGTYGLHHIVRESISGGTKETYNLGDDYYGMQLHSENISVILNNGSGVMSYSFEQSVVTNITYEVVDGKFIMTCEDAVDLFNNGNPQHHFELSIEEIDGKICFVLSAKNVYSIFSYYVIAQ